jgi:hypothetical protein
VDSNSIDGPLAQNRWCRTRKFLKIYLVSTIAADYNLFDHEIGGIGKIISLAFHAYVDRPNRGWTRLVGQFEGKVVLDSELDSKLDSCSLNWLGPPHCCACFLGSPTPS